MPIYRGAQLDKMRAAGEVARDVLLELADAVGEGVTTGAIDELAAARIRERGCRSAFLNYGAGARRFPGNICISVNEEVVHGIGGERVIRAGDVVKIDVGVVRDGWVGDNALTVAVGEIDPEAERLLWVTEEALHLGVSHARDGEMLGNMGHAIETFVAGNGFRVVRELVGHGVGRNLHEEPQVPNFGRRGERPRLRAGMILAIEPMVNQGTGAVRTLGDKWTVVTRDGKCSSHFEHTVLVTKGEPEILTWRERRMVARESWLEGAGRSGVEGGGVAEGEAREVREARG
jgi:methionyl aminopeptidase